MLSIVAMMFLSLLTTTQQAQAQTTYSGQAVGVIANATIINVVTANARLADTGPLPPGGGTQSSGPLVNASIELFPGASTNSRIDTTLIQTTTSGGAAAGTPNSSQSSALVNGLAVRLLANTVGGATVTATTVQSTSQCVCGATPVCSGTTTIENLQVNGVLIPIPGFATGTVTVTPAPNTTLLPALTGVAGLTIILNEQTTVAGSDNITVNAIHIIFRDPITGALIADIIVAQSYSDIAGCLAPTAATASISGRIRDVNGKSASRVIVTLTNLSTGESLTTRTNFLGRYTFEDVPTGGSYRAQPQRINFILAF
ncbi:MAG: carboxypeptidase-like regulatory domain-containing protein [Acidobacteria bacterium]|nr:carboxypeptidase-like regulatory domain-containing protein [Acidobacteriota bacterium]